MTKEWLFFVLCVEVLIDERKKREKNFLHQPDQKQARENIPSC